jgi:hypothetical protein
MAESKEVILYRYPNRPKYIPLDDSDLIEKTKIFIKFGHNKKEVVNKAIEKHPKLKETLLALLESK